MEFFVEVRRASPRNSPRAVAPDSLFFALKLQHNLA